MRPRKSFILFMVRRGGLEPPRCYPLAPQASASANSAISANANPYFFVGAVAGVAGAGVFFCCCCARALLARFSSTLPELRDCPLARIPRLSEVTMKSAAATVVAFDKTVAVPRGPKTVCDPMPPKAPARSAAFPLCSRTTRIKTRQTTTCTAVTAIVSHDMTF